MTTVQNTPDNGLTAAVDHVTEALDRLGAPGAPIPTRTENTPQTAA